MSKPAFPTVPLNHGYSHDSHAEGTGSDSGMRLIDYFAGQALPGVIGRSMQVTTETAAGKVAQECYLVAAAMMRESELYT